MKKIGLTLAIITLVLIPAGSLFAATDTDRDGYPDEKEIYYNYDYKTPCGQNIFTSGNFAYGQGRLASLPDEQCRAKFLKSELDRVIGKGKYKIAKKDWTTLVNAFIYGGYDLNDVVSTVKGKIVIHPTIKKSVPSYINLRGFNMPSDIMFYGQVTDAQTGKGLNKTYINLFTPDGKIVLASTVSNADGFYALSKSALISQKNYESANTRPETFAEFYEKGLTSDFVKDHCRVSFEQINSELNTENNPYSLYQKYCAKSYSELSDEEKFSTLDYNELFSTDLNLIFNKGEFTVKSTYSDKYFSKPTSVKITDKAQTINVTLSNGTDETITDDTLLYGRIIDASTNQPLPNIFMHIILPGGGSGASIHKQTNANGFYQFRKSEFQNKSFDNQFYLSINNGIISGIKHAAMYINLNSKTAIENNIKF